ncbi:MAG: PAS domain S-box protein [Dehalococcoidales bacterium]|nr:PAS domain S-box protein [Dehalococcoidales bacterium]
MQNGDRGQPSDSVEVAARAELILEGSADGILAIDSERRILAFNTALESLTGWSRDEVIGKRCFEVLGLEDDQGANLCQTRCPLLGEMTGPSSLDGIITTKDDRRRDVALRYSLPPSGREASLPVVVNVRDMGRLARAEALNSSLLAITSHELQTPISIIKAYASTLARPDVKWDEETIKDKLHAIEEESDRLSVLVSRLLYSSRIDSDTILLNRLVLDLPKEVHRVAERLTGPSETHQVEIDFPTDFPPVYADPEKIGDVLTNLLENAVKFSPEGGRIIVRGDISGDEVLITVTDEGIGIAPQEWELIFNRFYRADDARVRSTQGIGLGLHICKATVEGHGGRIWAHSGPGKGACFSFTLPVAGEE